MATNRIDWTAQPLGYVPDQVLATQLGVTRQAVWTARRKHSTTTPVEPNNNIEVVDMAAEDGTLICRDDRCTVVEVHAQHKITGWAPDPFIDPAYGYRKVPRHGDVLREIILSHIVARRCKVFREIYDDVRHDYGYVVSRTVWRYIEQLLDRDAIVNLKIAGVRSPGGYVRSDSPLLHDVDGRRFLLETLEDAYPTAA